MKKQLLISIISLSSILSLNAQIYTPGGTIQGSSNSNNIGIGIIPVYKLDILNNNGNILRLRTDYALNDFFQIANATSATNQFIPYLNGYHESDNRMALFISGSIPSFMDNGNTPIVIFDARYPDGSVLNRPLFSWTSYADQKMVMSASGNLGIGTTSPAYKLDVSGTIRAKEIKVESGWADFVFNDNYKLPSLSEVGLFINEHKHLPNIPSAKEVEEKGVNLGEMNALLLQKIEEMTLYMIDQQKQLLEQNKKIEQLTNLIKTTK